MTNFNQTPYLPNQLDFPTEEPKKLGIVLDKMYLDIANRVNDRSIGIFNVNIPIVVGDVYYFRGVQSRQISQREIYDVTSTAPINHGLPYAQIDRFVRKYGDFTDGTDWYGFIDGSPTAIAGQIVFYITATQIVFVAGAGAPTVTKGQIILEWVVIA